MKRSVTKEDQYASLIIGQIMTMLQDEDCSFAINLKELQEEGGENLKAFIHALATLAPTYICNKLAGLGNSNLEFNHMANQLVFEFSHKKEKTEG